MTTVWAVIFIPLFIRMRRARTEEITNNVEYPTGEKNAIGDKPSNLGASDGFLVKKSTNNLSLPSTSQSKGSNNSAIRFNHTLAGPGNIGLLEMNEVKRQKPATVTKIVI